MGRTRTKSKKSQVLSATTPETDEKSGPATSALLEKAQALIGQCDYDLARRFAGRILERSPKNADAKEILGVCQLEMGELDEAKQASVLVSHGSSFRLSSSLRHLRPSYHHILMPRHLLLLLHIYTLLS